MKNIEAFRRVSASHKNMRIEPCGALVALGMGLFGISVLVAQPKPEPDVLLFTDGERLTGQFVKSSGASLTFKSDALGEITVDWSKVKELQSSVKVAVIPKGVKLRKPSDATEHSPGHAIGARPTGSLGG